MVSHLPDHVAGKARRQIEPDLEPPQVLVHHRGWPGLEKPVVFDGCGRLHRQVAHESTCQPVVEVQGGQGQTQKGNP